MLDGPSAAGKTTLALALADRIKDLTFIPRYTTRAPRNVASDRREYLFVGRSDFDSMVQNGQFLEHRDYLFGMSYGFPRGEVEQLVSRGENAIGIINLDRVQELKANFPEAIAILIDVSPQTLRKRLESRGTNTQEQIAERLENAKTVARLRGYYDFVVPNEGNLDETLGQLIAIITDKLLHH